MSTPETPITPATLNELIVSVVAERKKVDEKLSELEQARAEQQALRDALAEEEKAYRASLARRFPEAAADVPASETADDGSLFGIEHELAKVSRTEAVATAVRELSVGGDVASPATIEQYLHARGRSDDRDQIGGVLAYLNRRGRVENPARAQWRWIGD